MIKIKGISRNVVVLGWVSFFTDLASEMLYPIMPLFLVGTLGASAAMLGIIDGLAEGVSSGLRWIGGALSDRYRRRKPFVFAGYTVSALSKPIMGLGAIFGGWPVFLIGRISDRFGKSIRTSARDALIADSTEPEYRGVAFGFHRAMDTCGAILGPLMALVVIILMVGTHTAFTAQWTSNNDAIRASSEAIQKLPLRNLFFFAALPGLVSAGLVIRGVKEILPQKPKGDSGPVRQAQGRPPPIFQKFPAPFWHLIVANAVFSLGNSSDSFLILRSGEVGLAFGHIILAFALYNTVYALASAPLGHLSDRIGRKPVIACGWIAYAAVYAGFAFLKFAWAPWILMGTYGLYQAFSEGVSKAMVSDLVAPEQRAGAIGLFYTVSGVGQFAASLLAGVLWNVRPLGGMMTAFAIGAVFALLAVPIVVSVPVHRFKESVVAA